MGNGDYLKACIDSVVPQLSGDEFIARVEMGALVPSKNAQFPFLITVVKLDSTGQPAGHSRSIIVDVTSNTPPTGHIRNNLDLGPSWRPL